MKTLVALALLIGAVGAWADKPKNIIFVIGDGMGMEYLTAYRHYSDNPATPELDSTWFDQHLLGTVSTHPIDITDVTDSASSATAMAAGVKTYNGAIGVNANREPVETLLERAKKRGYQTAMVATSQINHATPASFSAHVESRNQYDDIADQYLDRRFNGKPWVDILIGGGRKYFEREERNLVHEFQSLGYQYADNFDELNDLTSSPALALLADKGLPFAIDEKPHNRLEVMTQKALELLSPDRPFFLLVEASQIDWCGHANDIACAMAEMTDTEMTLKFISEYVAKRPNTLVVVTADHSTGGLSMGADRQYLWRAEVVRNIQASSGVIAQALIDSGDAWQGRWQELTGIPLNEKAIEVGQNLLGVVANAATTKERNEAVSQLEQAVRHGIDLASVTGWTTGGHTGGDVAVMALGPGAESFAGHQDNTDLAKKLFEVLQ
ncbi:alkaline phosphatase [Gilvimarinus sp. SDUM040013]|uniref:Alkaline phosphatase n=1 Tax=Gilvimarinus gilvus TaxID=3058038 RepID=A0ABU4RV82_9GAMM|nr:alkaline phosphatase [Gilvimarinus sp. SDUM040013]MDO3386925.1 alkaline phosphatase [Gilvimarinus sp. SDUM040013]MDX6848181.1 alkaline phosphatase [Gilvimarinus sp. SDUM040013]